MNTKEFYEEIRKYIKHISVKKIPDKIIEISEEQSEMLKELYVGWGKKGKIKEAENMLNDIFNSTNHNYGKIYEALIYAWLERHKIKYEQQVKVDKDSCFKTSDEGYFADGKIIEENIIFDTKQFGITFPLINTLRKDIQNEIEKENPKKYYLTITCGINISVESFKKQFLEKIPDLAKKIMCAENKINGDYVFKHNGLEFHVCNVETNECFYSRASFDPYEFAKNNELYFMHHASQFCLNVPYVIFCPFDSELAYPFTLGDKSFIKISLRALCRRIFINLLKNDQQVHKLDGKAREGITVSDASKKISAIIFIDVSQKFKYEDCYIYVYQNPNADNKIKRYQMDKLFRYNGAFIDDFFFDNY